MKIIGGTYRLTEKTEEGSFLAEHLRLHTTWLLRPIAKTDAGSFFEELPVIRQCSGHSAFPMAAGVLEEEDTWYLVKNYTPVKCLSQVYHPDAKPDETTLFALMYELSEVFEFLQNLSPLPVTYRLLTPDRLFLKEDGRVLLSDYRELKSEDFSDPAVYPYIAPEIRHGKPGDIRSDFYSLGAVIYKLLSHRVITNDREAYQPMKNLCPWVSGGMAYVLERLTDPDPGKRFQDVADFQKELRECYRYNDDYIHLKRSHKVRRSLFVGTLLSGCLLLGTGAYLHGLGIKRQQLQMEIEAAYIPPEKLYYQDGNRCRSREEYPEAIAYYELALAANAAPGPVYFALGQTYEKMASEAEKGEVLFSEDTSMEAVDDSGETFSLALPDLNHKTEVEFCMLAKDAYMLSENSGYTAAASKIQKMTERVNYLQALDEVLQGTGSVMEKLYEYLSVPDFSGLRDFEETEVFRQTLSYMEDVATYYEEDLGSTLALYPTGQCYFGDWADGKPEGEGALVVINSKKHSDGYEEKSHLLVGNWKNGLPQGDFYWEFIQNRDGEGLYLNFVGITGNVKEGIFDGDVSIHMKWHDSRGGQRMMEMNRAYAVMKNGALQVLSFDDLSEEAKALIESRYGGRDWYDTIGGVYAYEVADGAFSYVDTALKDLIAEGLAEHILP